MMMIVEEGEGTGKEGAVMLMAEEEEEDSK